MGGRLPHRFEESDNRLRITGELDSSALEPFGEHLKSFVAKATSDFTIDMFEIRYVTSSFAGYLAVALVDARKKGCNVTIRANERLARLLKVAGIDKLAAMEVG